MAGRRGTMPRLCKRAVYRSVVFLATALLICGSLRIQADAQTSRVVVRGKILDQSGAPIAGAEVAASRSGVAPLVPSISDQVGAFSLTLEAGSYTVKANKRNFVEVSKSLEVGNSDLSLDPFTLPVSPLLSTVEVTGDAAYLITATSSATRTLTPLTDVPQTTNVVTQQQVRDQLMLGIGDVIRYVPGVSAHQGENNLDEIIIRGVDSSADFYFNGMRDDVQYYRDLYNIDRVESLKGPNELTTGRGVGGGIVNMVSKEATATPFGEIVIHGGSFYNKRVAVDLNRPITDKLAYSAATSSADRRRDIWREIESCTVSANLKVGALR